MKSARRRETEAAATLDDTMTAAVADVAEDTENEDSDIVVRGDGIGELRKKKKGPAEISIAPPKFGWALFSIVALSPLVQHRFSAKTKEEMKKKAEAGRAGASKKNREAADFEARYEEARYRHKDGWDGFKASAFRNACISACRLVGFKMTLAKMAIFVEEDGWDMIEPQIPLVRIYGKPVPQEDMARTSTGEPYVTIRPVYHDWSAKVRVRFDQDIVSLQELTNLAMRAGLQVGIGEGRPDSKKSAGQGWGLFQITRVDALESKKIEMPVSSATQ